ncbi:MAG TPA: phosphoglucomutase/phosphomannomutase family protein [bacterium]|nr:phosphoglucomutase/phosphomannomutase family protein [bacterium]
MIKFGTDGWRAIIGDEFTFENVERVVQAYTDVAAAPKGAAIYVGHDRRFLSREFAERAAGVLAANGFTVHLSKDYCPTPCISVMTKNLKASGGVVITASHNPAPWNGVKFKESYGGSASPEFTAKVEKRLSEGVSVKRTGDGRILSFDPQDAYVKALRERVDVKAIARSNWKVAYDPLFGAGGGFLGKVLERPVHEIHGEENPAFGGLNPEPIGKNLGALTALVPGEGFDVGLATDGDADRIGAVDETGIFVTPQQIFALLLGRLIERGERGDVVKTVSTTGMIDAIAARHGLKVHETPIGFKHICAKFLETTPLIGGEESGGIGIPSHVYERDGLLCGLMLLEIMSAKNKRLGEILKGLEREIGPFHFVREDVHLSDEQRTQVEDAMTKDARGSLAGLKIRGVNRLDGTKYLLETGSWLLLRLSGTEPLLRIYAETHSPQQTRDLIREGRLLLGLA